ncbi:hypothetical protein [Paenibacillus sp. 1P07SE]|uniref:hypothetical protein n=1 Tax=Paenibacillus sp. 1P07SE TaxID=3132209 RepID=UPI0039A56CF9
MMKPITAKELEYLVDSMSNEDLLMKQCAVTAATASNQDLRHQCLQLQVMHQQHYDALLHALEQHQQMAPSQPQH